MKLIQKYLVQLVIDHGGVRVRLADYGNRLALVSEVEYCYF